MTPEEAWLRQQRRHARPWLLLSGLAGWAAAVALVLMAWLLAQLVTDLAFRGVDPLALRPRLLLLLGLLPLRTLLLWGGEQAAARGAVQLQQRLRADLVAQVRRLGPAWLARQDQGALATSLVEGVDALGGYYARYLPAVTRMATVPLTLLLFIAPLDWLAALVLAAMAPLVPFFMILIGKGAERRNRRQWRQLARMSAHFLDLVRGLATLKLFGASAREGARVEEIAEEYRRRTLSVLRVAFLSSFTLEFFATVSIAVVAVTVGFRLYWGQLEFLPGFFALLLAPEFYAPLRNLGSAYHDRMEALGAAPRLREILLEKPPAQAGGTRPFRPAAPKGITLRLEEVGFRWAGGRAALDGISLEIAAGERIAIVGPSGAGKSTLFQLLLKFLEPEQGRILADGQPLAELDPAQWRRHLAWVPQSPRLFHASVLENIRLGRPDASLEEVERAAERARCLDFIHTLPRGFHTLVGEGGRGLSGGQRQRIALARAFLRDAPLVLLDEPTAHLDLESEARIQEAVEELADGRTLLVIAHRLQTVRRADRILVLEQGRLVEAGRHRELAARRGAYARLLGAAA